MGPGQYQVLEVTSYLSLSTLWFPALSPTEEPEDLGKEEDTWVSSDLKRPYGWLGHEGGGSVRKFRST